MSFAARMQKTANKLLGKFDESKTRLALLKLSGPPVWDPVLGEMVTPKPDEIPLIGVTVAYSDSMIDGTTIQAGDVLAIVQDGGITVSQSDKLLIDGVQWSIVSQPRTDYTGVNICHKIHARK